MKLVCTGRRRLQMREDRLVTVHASMPVHTCACEGCLLILVQPKGNQIHGKEVVGVPKHFKELPPVLRINSFECWSELTIDKCALCLPPATSVSTLWYHQPDELNR